MPNNSIEQNPSWEANSRSVGHEIRVIIWDRILFLNIVFLKFLRSRNTFCLKAEMAEYNIKTYSRKNGK
jgi:hypothetical protein